MGLNPRGRGRGRGGGGKAPFLNKGRRGGGMVGPGPIFRPGPPGMFCPPPMGFPPEPHFNGPFFGGPSGFYGPPRPAFGKFPRKNFKRKPPQRNNDPPVPEIDLTKPWVTEEIKTEEGKKQELLEIWRKSKNDEDWRKYKAQKLSVQTLYDKAKEEYLASHPEEAVLWQHETFKTYFCESCDKTFRTDDDFYLHEAEHETCGREGCEFTAHPKIIAKHITMQHDSGLYERIGKLYTEEDIAKWIEERKKRYPSRKVIEEKKALEEEKIKRGERIQEDKSRFNKSFTNRKNKDKIFEKKTLKVPKAQRTKKKQKVQVVQHYEENLSLESTRTGIPAFIGIKKCFESEKPQEEKEEQNELKISDDEWEVEVKHEVKPLLNQSLLLLASNYDSEEEVEEESKKDTKLEELSIDEGSAPEEVKTVRSNSPLPEEKPEPKAHKRKIVEKKNLLEKKKKLNVGEKNPVTRNLTLLEKLLKNEIRHERNVILQCVNYIVKNNFFSVSTK